MSLLQNRCFAALLIIITSAQAAPYSWLSNEVGYDASLDPVVWSRAFAKDTIRKPRYMQAFAKLRNIVGVERDAEDLTRLMNQSMGQGFTEPSFVSYAERNSFDKRRRKAPSLWLDDASTAGSNRKPVLKKSIYRKRQRSNGRRRYGA